MYNIITQKEDPELPCRRLNQGLGAHVNQELSFKHKKDRLKCGGVGFY